MKKESKQSKIFNIIKFVLKDILVPLINIIIKINKKLEGEKQ